MSIEIVTLLLNGFNFHSNCFKLFFNDDDDDDAQQGVFASTVAQDPPNGICKEIPELVALRWHFMWLHVPAVAKARWTTCRGIHLDPLNSIELIPNKRTERY